MIVFIHIWCLINDIHEQVKVTKQLLNPLLARLSHMHNFRFVGPISVRQK